MKKLTLILASAMLLASCSQIKTNKSELAILESTAKNSGDAYVACLVNYSLENTSAGAIDVATAVKLAGNTCQTELTQFTKNQNEYLSAQLIMTKKPLQASIDTLNERATTEVGEALLLVAKTQPAGAKPVTAAIATSGVASEWSDAQQAYLSCMEDQARRYAGLDESATVIADVAQGRCKSLMAGPDVALEKEGRANAMGVVLDAKLAAPN